MQQIEVLEPNSADVPYYIGEAYRLQGDYNDALAAYSQALHVDSQFAPGYLGSARADLLRDPNANVTTLLAQAITDDPNLGEAYLERANYYMYHNQPALALSDLDAAGKRMPNSALVQLAYARAYLAQGNAVPGLAAAQKANQIDVTLLPAYLVLGQAYVANSQCSEAVKPLQTYVVYQPNDGGAYALLGQCDEVTGDYATAADTLTKALSLDPTQYAAYLYRGLAYLELNNSEAADGDLRKAIEFFPNSFNANLGILRLSYLEAHYGDAYLHILPTSALAQTDAQKALVLYWTALIQEKRTQPKEALAAWKSLLAMPADAMTSQMRDDATQHLALLVTATPTPPGGVRTEPTLTLTPSPTTTPRATP